MNPICPACKDYRLHTKEEFEQYHPTAGDGEDNIGRQSIKKDKECPNPPLISK